MITLSLDTLKAILTSDYSIYEIKSLLFDALTKAQPRATSQAGRYILHGSVGWGGDARPYETYFLDGRLTGSKIAAIKYIRTLTQMGLKEAKEYVEALPVVIETSSLSMYE